MHRSRWSTYWNFGEGLLHPSSETSLRSASSYHRMARRYSGLSLLTTQMIPKMYVADSQLTARRTQLARNLVLQWTNRRKSLQLLIVTLATIIPDFDSSIGKSSPRV